MSNSNLHIKSNLMIGDPKGKLLQYVPGYLLKPLGYRDSRVINKLPLSKQQIYEYEMTIMCVTCGRPCAGTCQNRK